MPIARIIKKGTPKKIASSENQMPNGKFHICAQLPKERNAANTKMTIRIEPNLNSAGFGSITTDACISLSGNTKSPKLRFRRYLNLGMPHPKLSNVEFINNSKIPGTAFTATIEYTEGDCHATYDAVAFWPSAHYNSHLELQDECEVDDDCSPEPNTERMRPLGSGFNPEFKPICDPELKVCVPSVDLTTIK